MNTTTPRLTDAEREALRVRFVERGEGAVYYQGFRRGMVVVDDQRLSLPMRILGEWQRERAQRGWPIWDVRTAASSAHRADGTGTPQPPNPHLASLPTTPPAAKAGSPQHSSQAGPAIVGASSEGAIATFRPSPSGGSQATSTPPTWEAISVCEPTRRIRDEFQFAALLSGAAMRAALRGAGLALAAALSWLCRALPARPQTPPPTAPTSSSPAHLH